MSERTYIAQRVSTGEFLHWDLPIEIEELRWELSGINVLRGHLDPEVVDPDLVLGSDGRPILDEWGTFLYLDNDGVIEWGGIVLHSKHEGSKWLVEAAGFATYPHGTVYDSLYKQMDADPLAVMRHIWTHIQSKTAPSGDLGVVITGDATSDVELGSPALPAYDEVLLDGVWQTKSAVPSGDIEPRTSAPLYTKISNTATSLKLKRIAQFDQLTPPYNVTVGHEVMTVASRDGLNLNGLTRGVGTSTATGHYSGTAVQFAGTPTRTVLGVPAQPYTLAWYDSPDCGEEINALSDETPFDYVETHRWEGSEIVHEIETGYPRLGVQRTDLSFVMGDNVISLVEVDRDGDEYANEVIGLGRGEGPASVRATAKVDDGRLRRTRLHPNKTVGTKARLQTFVNRELAARRNIESIIETITVTDHENAPIGSWNLGDDILVQADLPWIGSVYDDTDDEQGMWCRVVAWTLDSETTATLHLTRFSSSPQARLARELAAISRRVAPLERTTQMASSSLVDEYGNSIDLANLSRLSGVSSLNGYDYGPGAYTLDPEGNPVFGESFPYDADGNPDYSAMTPKDLSDASMMGYSPGNMAAMEAADTALGQVAGIQGMIDDGTIGGGGGGPGGGGNMYAVVKVGTWPARPSDSTDITVTWIGADPPPPVVTSGTAGAYNGDLWVVT